MYVGLFGEIRDIWVSRIFVHKYTVGIRETPRIGFTIWLYALKRTALEYTFFGGYAKILNMETTKNFKNLLANGAGRCKGF